MDDVLEKSGHIGTSQKSTMDQYKSFYYFIPDFTYMITKRQINGTKKVKKFIKRRYCWTLASKEELGGLERIFCTFWAIWLDLNFIEPLKIE